MALLGSWLSAYRLGCPALAVSQGTTLFLDDLAEPELDLHLGIRPESGGQTRVEGAYRAGAPELVVEVSRTTRAIDLGPRRADYERAAACESLGVAREPPAIHWFRRVSGRFQSLPADGDGLYRNGVERRPSSPRFGREWPRATESP